MFVRKLIGDVFALLVGLGASLATSVAVAQASAPTTATALVVRSPEGVEFNVPLLRNA